MENTLDFEKIFVDHISGMLQEKGISHNEFGKLVFGETDGGRLWRSIRDPQNSGKRRKVTINEAYTMATVLGTDLPYIMWQISQILNAKKEGQTQ